MVVGYSVGASHVASYLAHPEFQVRGPGVAGVVLVSGIYRADPDASAAEKAYFGDDASKYEARSAFPGIVRIEMPILLAWSVMDSPRLIAQGEKLKEFLCSMPAHCPRTRVLESRDGLSSVFAPDVSSGRSRRVDARTGPDHRGEGASVRIAPGTRPAPSDCCGRTAPQRPAAFAKALHV